jgi:hypothetical protein
VPGLALLLAALTGVFVVSLDFSSPLTYVAIWSPAISVFTVICLRDSWAGGWAYARRFVGFTGQWGWYAGVLPRFSWPGLWLYYLPYMFFKMDGDLA